ncbi:hypothetical protein L486_08030 [Kwoniella mangroviensis CBS 10435]|uniref:WSC domain-containing protein n=1 Tax=Kwoniella mangroviensis CBS 10435 TaxID=1331196 RepID=A0A1B9IGC5_9TREE|nr:hypothetical protein L486_08030 [Kwoniella mangroviensis CBS 10435]
MVKLQASFTLSLLIAILSIGSAQAEVAGARNGPRRHDKAASAGKRSLAPRATDPWANFKSFDWSTWQTNWGWAGHTLAYVKAWYYDEYGLNLPSGVRSWPELSYYVSYFGTYKPTPSPSISSYGGGNTEDPWVTGTLASSSTSSSKAASTSTSTSTSTSSAKSSSSSAAAASSSAIISSTSSSKASSTSSSAAASSSAASLTGSAASSSTSSSVAASSSSSSSSKAASSSSSSVAASSSSSAAALSSSSKTASSSSSSSVAASSSSSSVAASNSVAASSSSAAASSSVASSSTSSSTSSSASASATATVPSGWKKADIPCIADGKTGRALLGSFTIDYNNTIEGCLARCDAGGFAIAGIEYGNQCFCGSYLSNGASLSTTATCAVACPGNKDQTCGGYYALSLYVSTKLNGAALSSDLLSVAATLPDGWSTASKCMQEVNGRALTDYSWATDAMTVPLCLNKCASLGYQYGGIEYGRECYCGNSLDNGADLTKTSTLCGTPCAGNPSTPCGGWNALQVYNNPAYSYSNTIVNGYVKTACLQEVANRALRGAAYKDETGMTVETCTQYCADRGFIMAGLEYGSECYCGSALVGGASLLLTSGECKMNCVGNANENCGGANAIWLYINPNTLTASVTLPTGWTYKGCIGEGSSARALNFTATDLITKGTMTGEKCARQCSESGYTMAGTEYASQCYCGNSFQGGATGKIIDTITDGTSQCNYPCPGNAAQMCGGGYRLSLYSSLVTLPGTVTTAL